MVGGLLDDGGLLSLGPRGLSTPEAPVPEGTCHICRTRPGRFRCCSCGRAGCAADTWVMFGLCRACSSDGDMARWHLRGEPEGRNWLEEPAGEAAPARTGGGEPA